MNCHGAALRHKFKSMEIVYKSFFFFAEKPKTVYTNAKKQLIIYSPPAILTLHLKRFQQNGYSFNKVNRHVDFSMTLDLAPYCSTLSQVNWDGEAHVEPGLGEWGCEFELHLCSDHSPS